MTVGVIAMSLNVALSIAFSAWFSRIGWMPHGGLALANSLATFLEMGALLYLMRRRLGGLEGKRALTGLAQALVAAGAMGGAIWGWLRLAAMQEFSVWVTGLGGVAVGVVVYGVMVLLLRVPEVRMLADAIQRRWLKKASTG